MKHKSSKAGLQSATLLLWFGLGAAAPLGAQPVPHHFSDIIAGSNGDLELKLDGSVSNMFNVPPAISNQFMQMFDLYPVEASPNLVDWTPLALLLRTNNDPSALVFTDINAAGLDHRFYRTPTNHLITFLQAPGGSFTVGTLDRIMVDPARTNLYRYTPPTNAFMLTFWYPARPPLAGTRPAPMWSKRIALEGGIYAAYGDDPRWTNINSVAVGHRYSNLPLPAGSSRYPVVIYSHGLPSIRQNFSQQCEELASRGYIVMAPDHSDCWGTDFPDGRYLSGNHLGDVPSRLKDLSFLLDELARMDAGDPFFAGRLDLDHIALCGHSFGGEVVQIARTDSRVSCVVVYDAENLNATDAPLQVPLLAMVGESNFYYADDLALFTRAATNAVFLQVRGATHSTCSDIAWMLRAPQARSPALAIDGCIVWFLGKYLKGEQDPFPTNPELYNVQMK